MAVPGDHPATHDAQSRYASPQELPDFKLFSILEAPVSRTTQSELQHCNPNWLRTGRLVVSIDSQHSRTQSFARTVWDLPSWRWLQGPLLTVYNAQSSGSSRQFNCPMSSHTCSAPASCTGDNKPHTTKTILLACKIPPRKTHDHHTGANRCTLLA